VHGGCKVRKLEFLLGDALARGANTISVMSASCSNFLVSTATHAERLGLKTVAMLYDQYQSAAARRMHARIDGLGVPHSGTFRRLFFPLIFLLHKMGKVAGVPRREWSAPGYRLYIMPPGGSSPIGNLGFLSAALELADQVARGELPPPDVVVAPIGSGGVMAGLLAGFHLCGLPGSVVGVRVVDRLVANSVRVSALANATLAYLRSLVEMSNSTSASRSAKESPAQADQGDLKRRLSFRNPIRPRDVRILDGYFGGEYARPTTRGIAATRVLEAETGICLEPTYSAKTFSAALDVAREARRGTNVLFWCTSPGLFHS
jgi:D-cysteine desulfhydrase